MQGRDGAVGAKEARFKSAAAFAALFENAHRFRDQRPQNILYRREIEKGLGEAPLDHAFRQGPQGRDARVLASQNARQPPHGFVAETRRQRGRGTIGEIAQGRQAGARQRDARLSWRFERGDGAAGG